MRIFKKAAGFIVVNLIIVMLLTFMLAPPSIFKLSMQEVKNGGFDTLIVGQSHATAGYDPYVISDATGTRVYNLSKGGMPVENFSYIIEEANVNGRCKKVIWDIDPSYWRGNHRDGFAHDTNLLFTLTGGRWFDYVKNVLAKDNYNAPFVDYYVSIGTIKKIPQNLKRKLNKAYLIGDESCIPALYSNIESSYEYKGRGFHFGVRKTGDEWSLKNFNQNSIREENMEAFKKIIAYCKDNNIELICVQSAVSPYRLKNENLDEAHRYFTALCGEYNVPFYDLNYLKAEYLSRIDDEYGDLEGHMSGELAERQSEVLGQILMAENKEAFFYDNYEDVLSHLT